jgi:hypothetical protein
VSEFEDFINVLLTDEEAAHKQISDEFNERISRKEKAISACREAIIEAFDNIRFGHYFKVHDVPSREIEGDNFDLSMAGKDVVLHFTGKIFESEGTPNGFAAMVVMKAARAHASTVTAAEYDVHCEFKEDGECVPEDLFETVTAAVRDLITAPSLTVDR